LAAERLTEIWTPQRGEMRRTCIDTNERHCRVGWARRERQ